MIESDAEEGDSVVRTESEEGASVVRKGTEDGAEVVGVARKGVGAPEAAGGDVVFVGPGENVSKAYDGMGVIVGTADSVGVLVGRAATGVEVVSSTLSHCGPVNPAGQTHPNAPSPCITQTPSFLQKSKVSMSCFRVPARSPHI